MMAPQSAGATPYAVLVVIEQDGCLVMPEYPKDPGYFVLPGGKTEPGETPRQTAEREAREETVLLVDVDPEPFFTGESHNGEPMWAYRATWNPRVDARLPSEWSGPEGRVRLIPIGETEATYKPDFLPAFHQVMDAYKASRSLTFNSVKLTINGVEIDGTTSVDYLDHPPSTREYPIGHTTGTYKVSGSFTFTWPAARTSARRRPQWRILLRRRGAKRRSR